MIGQKKPLTYSHMGMYIEFVAPGRHHFRRFQCGGGTPPAGNALNFLTLQERAVGDIVQELGMEQPSVSKHLRVLLDVGLVRVRRDGRRMLYRTDAEAIRPLHEWTGTFERLWRNQIESLIKERAESTSDGPKTKSTISIKEKS